ncbi:MAG: glycosyltransferase family 4 protein [Parcubacteria group bacterium]|nr:glycosyltransferase family 4 protein [Parcubacteria group bacterium]
MKVLQINKFYYLKGGSERHIFALSKLLADSGHQVVQFSMADDKNYYSKFSQYFSKPVNLDKFSLKNIFKLFYNREAAKKLENLIRAERPDLAHLHNISHQLSSSVIKVLKKYNIPLVQTLHDYKLICPNYKLFSHGRVCYKCRGGKYYNCFLNKCLKNSYLISFLAMFEAYYCRWQKVYEKINLFIAPSRFMKDICVKFGVPENKIKLIYNFINPETGAVENLAEKSQPDYFLYFGRLSEEKGIRVLLEAMKKLNGIKLKIAGAGPDYKKYQSLAAEYKLNDRVEFLGPKYGDELRRLIKQAKAVIMPSLWPENLPYTALESLSLNKIVIASNIGGLPEIIQDGFNGLLFKSGDSLDLAGKISLILNDERMAKSIETNAKSSLNKFNSQEHYRAISRVYQNLVKF